MFRASNKATIFDKKPRKSAETVTFQALDYTRALDSESGESSDLSIPSIDPSKRAIQLATRYPESRIVFPESINVYAPKHRRRDHARTKSPTWVTVLNPDFRFKLYMEGWAWSASGKYILACDATTLMVESEWYEFWYRGLKPGVNFLPVAKAPNLCANIRKTVDWGRAHPRVAKQIGRAGTEFLMREVNMPLVYDYMLHVLREYASLQTFK